MEMVTNQFKGQRHRIKTLILVGVIFLTPNLLWGQEHDSTHVSSKKDKAREKISGMPLLGQRLYTYNYKQLSQTYRSRENPIVGWRSSIIDDETILFDFHPTLTLSMYNNFEERLSNERKFSMRYYFAFRPQFRMYSKNSTPVQMPSYRIFIGFKHLFRLNAKHLIGYALESGHYSNGQPGCALSSGIEDGSESCDSIYALLTPNSNLSEMINRDNGDFSTNLSEMTLSYHFISKLDEYQRPKEVHTANFGIMYYHNKFFGLVDAGGHTANSIATYGRWRFLLYYEYSHQWKSGYRINVSENIELIANPHPSVNILRTTTTATIFLPRSIGLYVSYIYGHDDYNLRFVDSGHQFGMGLVWDMFPPKEIGGNKVGRK